MATFTETRVTVSVFLMVAADNSKHVLIDGTSYDANGTPIRSLGQTEVTSALNATQQQEALDLVNAATAYLKNLWGIA